MARAHPRHLAGGTPPEGRRRVRIVVVSVLTSVVLAGAAGAAWSIGRSQPDGGARAEPGAETTGSTRPAITTSTTAIPRRSARLVFGGDVLIHQGVWQAARGPAGYDFSPMLAPITPVLQAADLALCHLEVTLARPTDPPSGYPRFRAPRSLAGNLVGAGFDGCSVASNHALDYGEQGVDSTLDAFDEVHLGHAGTARNPEEDARPATYSAAGISIAHLSYAYGFNGFRPPVGKEWMVDQIDPARILADAHAARAAGAEVVIVSLHWGNEYTHGVTDAQRKVAEAIAADAGAVDLIVGHHAHVVQPISKVGDLWVVWGMGNLLSSNTPRCCKAEATDGVLVTVTFSDRPDGAGVGVEALQFTPTWNERRTYRVLPAAETLAAGVDDPALADDLRASYERTTAHILELAGTTLPITPTATLPPR